MLLGALVSVELVGGFADEALVLGAVDCAPLDDGVGDAFAQDGELEVVGAGETYAAAGVAVVAVVGAAAQSDQ